MRKYKKTLVTDDNNFDGEGTYKEIDWNDLLEAAIQSAPQLDSLMKNASIDDVKDALLTLKQAYDICTHVPKDYGYETFAYGWYEVKYSRDIEPETLLAARKNILSSLDKQHDPAQLMLNEKEKRTLKKTVSDILLEKIEHAQSVEVLLGIYHENIHSVQLNFRRNPHVDFFRSQLLGDTYTNTKIKFIEALQNKVLQFSMRDEEIVTLSQSLFSRSHLKYGVSKQPIKNWETAVIDRVPVAAKEIPTATGMVISK